MFASMKDPEKQDLNGDTAGKESKMEGKEQDATFRVISNQMKSLTDTIVDIAKTVQSLQHTVNSLKREVSALVYNVFFITACFECLKRHDSHA